MDFNMYVPTKILFGAGTLNELGKQQLPGKKAVIIISNGKSTRANGYLSRTEEQLAQAGVATSVFDKIQPNPLKETVMEGAPFVKAQDADFIVALGGGSVIDSAKAIAVMAANPGDLWDYIASGTGKGQPIKNKPLPIVAISTTAGTGWTQEWGKKPVMLKPGNIVRCPPGVKHWHGGSAKMSMTHITLSEAGGTVTWLEPVSDEDYPKD